MIGDLQKSIDNLTAKFVDLSETIVSLKLSKEKSEKIVQNLTNDVEKISTEINNREQHHCNSSIRIFGLEINDSDAKDPISTSGVIYNKLLKPILELTVNDETLEKIPNMLELIEYAHVLPSCKIPITGKKISPIICRFQSRLMKSIIFRNKKQFLSSSPTMKSIFITEDLTAANFKKLFALKNDDTIPSAWSMGGRIFFKEKSEPEHQTNCIIYYGYVNVFSDLSSESFKICSINS